MEKLSEFDENGRQTAQSPKTAWEKLVSVATTEQQLDVILALVERQYDESMAVDDDDRAHRHVTVRYLRNKVAKRRRHLQEHYLQVQNNLLADYIRRQKKNFGWYLTAEQMRIDLLRHLNGGAEKGGEL